MRVLKNCGPSALPPLQEGPYRTGCQEDESKKRETVCMETFDEDSEYYMLVLMGRRG